MALKWSILVLAGSEDVLMFNNQPRVVQLLPRGRLVEIDGGGVQPNRSAATA